MTGQHASHQYLAAAVEAADPLQRVVMLHEHAVRSVRTAIRHIDGKEPAAAHAALTKAKNIVVHLLASVPEDDDSELAAHLRGLFKFAYAKLVEGNLRKDRACVEAALDVLRTLAAGWAEFHAQNLPTASAPSAGPATLAHPVEA